MKVLLPIHPKYVKKIFSGVKRFEYRKSIFGKPVKTVLIYATSPVCRVVGEFDINYWTVDDVERLWKFSRMDSGMAKNDYDSYFKSQDLACAMRIGRVIKYDVPKKLGDYGIVHAPQSYCYVEN